MKSLWNRQYEPDVVNSEPAIHRYEAYPLAAYDIALLGEARSAHTRLRPQYGGGGNVERMFMPASRRYPQRLLAVVSTSTPGPNVLRTPDGAHDYKDLVVVVKQRPGARWRLALLTNFDAQAQPTTPFGTLSGSAPERVSGPLPASAQDSAATALKAQVDYLAYVRENGVPPAHTQLAPGPSTSGLVRLFAGNVPGVSEHQTRRADLRPNAIFTFPLDAGWNLGCGAVRARSVAKGSAGEYLWQDRDRTNWGWSLPPGRYTRIVSRALDMTCIATPPVHGQQLQVFGYYGGWLTARGGGHRH